MKKEMSEGVWKETRTGVATVSWDNKPIRLEVPAIRNTKTGKVRVKLEDVALAELEALAKEHGIESRDLPILLTLKAQMGGFANKEEVQFQYHLNKMLFYQWKEMEKLGLGETFPHDQFVKADRGPVPLNIDADLTRLSQMGLISIERHRWGKRPRDESKQIRLTPKGSAITNDFLKRTPKDLLTTTAEVKTRIGVLTPASVREKVHKEFPEYKNTYTEEDSD